jgi:hypothetical protein
VWHRTEIAVSGESYAMRIDDRPTVRGGFVAGPGPDGKPAPTAAGGRRLVLRSGGVPIEFANIFVKPDTVSGAHLHH